MVRLMEVALQGLINEICLPYLDDIAVWSNGTGPTLAIRLEKSFYQLLQRLDLVFKRLILESMTCKATKCSLFTTLTTYLGHVLSRRGLEMCPPDKVAAVRNWAPESINSLDKVRSFLGLCGYYRRFVKGFAVIAAPLTTLTKKDCMVEEQLKTAACQDAIVALKLVITTDRSSRRPVATATSSLRQTQHRPLDSVASRANSTMKGTSA